MPELAAPATTDWPDDLADAIRRDRHGPYGLLGVTISVVLIVASMLLLLVAIAAATFGIMVLAFGLQGALDRLVDLRAGTPSAKAFAERLELAVALASYVILSGLTLAAARYRGGRWWPELVAWRPWHPFRGSWLVWLLIPLTIVYGLGADVVVAKVYPESKDWVTLPHGALSIGLFVALAVVAAPVTEELLFRGWIYTSLRARSGVWAGILVTSTLFALAHWEKTHIYALAVFPVGLALAFIRERTGSIKASMTCHAAYNGAAALILVFGS